MEIKSISPITVTVTITVTITITRLTTTINQASNLIIMTAIMKTNSSLRNQIQTSPPTALLILIITPN